MVEKDDDRHAGGQDDVTLQPQKTVVKVGRDWHRKLQQRQKA